MHFHFFFQYPNKSAEVRSLPYPFPSLAPIKSMDKSPEPLGLAENCGNEETFENVTKNDQGTMSNNYNQRNYAFSQAGTLRRHLKTHSAEKYKNVINGTLPFLIQVI